MTHRPTTTEALYRRHLEIMDGYLADALTRAAARGVEADAVLFHAGRAQLYHADDQEIPFRPAPHFLRWVPLDGPEHCVLARPGRRPLVVRVAPKDYWYEVRPLESSYWNDAVDLVEVASFAEVPRALGDVPRTAYVGSSPEAAAELGIDAGLVQPEALVKPLDWYRAVKSEHEIALIEIAAARGAAGHAAARDAFMSGASEREVHWAYLRGSGMLERELQFETIVAFDDKSATLHYQNKRAAAPGRAHTFLMDAGATADGYNSDITRTWLKSDADPVFAALLAGLDRLQRELVAMVAPGLPYPEIHLAAHDKTAALLGETGVVRASAEEALASGLTRTFLPHGVGHHLGLQVHDVGGHQADPDGARNPPPPEHGSLRNTRVLAPGHVVTIEPGIYFIPMLLEQLRAGPAARLVDWRLVERLAPLGGMRIEDDVVCTGDGARDVTRPLVHGPRGADS